MAQRKKQLDVGAAELEALKTLWDEGPGTVRDVLQRLRRRGKEPAYTTVMTFLTRLEQKGFVRSDRSGQAYVYQPTVQREQVVSSRLKTTLSQLFDGSAAPMVMHLMENERFTPEELTELQALVDRLSAQKSDAKTAKKPIRKRGKRS